MQVETLAKLLKEGGSKQFRVTFAPLERQYVRDTFAFVKRVSSFWIQTASLISYLIIVLVKDRLAVTT